MGNTRRSGSRLREDSRERLGRLVTPVVELMKIEKMLTNRRTGSSVKFRFYNGETSRVSVRKRNCPHLAKSSSLHLD